MNNFPIPRIYLYGGDYMYLILGILITTVTAKYAFCLYYAAKLQLEAK